MQLTSRERQIATWLCEGIKPKEIANFLGISPGTIKRHSINICRKLGVRGQCGIVSAILLPINSPLREGLYK